MAQRQEHRGSPVHGLALLLALYVTMTAVAPATAATPNGIAARFATPQQAVDALVAATRTGRTDAWVHILGRAGLPLIRSADPVEDRQARRHFLAAFDREHRIKRQGAGKAILVVGAQHWPLPIPLIRTASGWAFDTAAGRQEVLDRRIGHDELAVIEVCRAYVEAQRQYAALAARTGGRSEYARRFMSRRGTHDGLYWPTRPDAPLSPLGPLIAAARAAGYAPGRGHDSPHPYFGYFFRILTAQGPHAPGGAQSYLVGRHMIGGFALLAYPAQYGHSGVMTFLVNQQGIVFQKNLGPRTQQIATQITRYDPDDSWQPALTRKPTRPSK